MTDEGRNKRVRALFDSCVSKLETEDESIDVFAKEYIEMLTARMAHFKQMVADCGLPTSADMLTWHALFRSEWEAANGDILSHAQILELANR